MKSDSVASILIIDDNPKLLADALPMYGYNVTVASNGMDALNILTKDDTEFDLILLDVMMPVMDGWETLKAIRKNSKTKRVPIIMLTAVNEEQKMVSGLKIGADDYIIKPFILPNLLARIEAVLRRCQWQKENIETTQKNNNKTPSILTPKEKEVLSYVAQGASNQEIAKKLFVQNVTVKTHLNSTFKKLNVSNRTQAVLLALQMNIVDN